MTTLPDLSPYSFAPNNIAIDLGKDLDVIARSKDGDIMGVKHKTKKIYGVQFHPESIMTKDGIKILRNFLSEGK